MLASPKESFGPCQRIIVTFLIELISKINAQAGPAHCYSTDLRKKWKKLEASIDLLQFY
jgi:hypothetical protein